MKESKKGWDEYADEEYKKHVVDTRTVKGLHGDESFFTPSIQELFPTSETIDEKINLLVSESIKFSEGYQHGRETLDDIISDLIQYRKSIATPEEYLAKNWL